MTLPPTHFSSTIALNMKTLLIDNYDSYTFNLFQLLAEVNGKPPLVIRNDQLSWEELVELDFDNIVISPGPGWPNNERDFGICHRVLSDLDIPILGVCLGHQGLGFVYGATIVHAPTVMHGQLSKIKHNDDLLFTGIPQSFQAVRYHSLMVAAEFLPDELEEIAWAEDGVIMALRHRTRPLWGVQFHPESVSTEYGRLLIENFATITTDFLADCPQAEASSKVGVSQHYSVVPSRPEMDVRRESDFSIQSRKLDVLYDPEQVFANLYMDEPFAFWLDSSRVEVGLSRFSFMGWNTGPLSQVVQYETLSKKVQVTKGGVTQEIEGSIFDYLDQELERMKVFSPELPFDLNCGFVGYFGYEMKAECGSSLKYESHLPDASFIFADRVIVFDHLEKALYLVHLLADENNDIAEAWFDAVEKKLETLPALTRVEPSVQHEKTPVEFHLHRSYSDYVSDIRQCKKYLSDGESYEICLTNQISTKAEIDPLALYRLLREVNPAPYAAFLRFGEHVVLSSSPERFLRLDRDRWVEAKPIKGTVKRGKTLQEDESLREELQYSEKNRAENLMIVDLLRNDLGLVCDIGSVHVPKLMYVESYATVHQLVSTVRGHLRDDLHVVDCVRAAFPGGSMTGAPKLRTMELIDQLEHEARGIYSGTIGFLGLNGTADLSIVIRTIISTPAGLSMGVGGAITILSDEDEEYDEMLLKSEALTRAIMTAAHGEFNEQKISIKE